MKPKLSVCMVTYNHENFIKQAIESVLMQKVNFDYEIVIGEDCSTDKTKEIVIKYQNKYPNIIKAFINKKNLGAGLNFIKTLKGCKGEYIALLDGDDYWTNQYKLQKQVDFLSCNPDYSISSHNVYVTQDGRKGQPIEWLGENHREISTLEDILRDGSGGATCSLVFRSKSINPLPKWYYGLHGGDWALQVICTSKGKMSYFYEVMGVYRQHQDSATDFKKGSIKKLNAFLSGGVSLCKIFDEHFNYKYTRLIKEQLVKYMYPTLIDIYIDRGDTNSAKKYSLLILREILSGYFPPFKEVIKYVLLFTPKWKYE